MTTFERIAAILTTGVYVDPSLIMPSATAISMQMDSIDQVEFAVELELAFELDLPESFYDTISTLGELEFALERVMVLGVRAV